MEHYMFVSLLPLPCVCVRVCVCSLPGDSCKILLTCEVQAVLVIGSLSPQLAYPDGGGLTKWRMSQLLWLFALPCHLVHFYTHVGGHCYFIRFAGCATPVLFWEAILLDKLVRHFVCLILFSCSLGRPLFVILISFTLAQSRCPILPHLVVIFCFAPQ